MSRRTNKRKQATTVAKAGNESLAVSRVRAGEMGTNALSHIRADSERMMNEELRWPQFIGTVEAMKQDHTVATALDTKYVFVAKAFNEFTVLSKRGSEASKKAAEFVEYCFKNMDGQTLRQFARSAATFNEYGFSAFEKVYTKELSGKYTGYMKLKRLAFRPQASLSRRNPFEFTNGGRDLVGLWQSQAAFVDSTNRLTPFAPQLAIKIDRASEVLIPAEKLVLMSYGGTESNPAGISPLVGCYRAFREKILIENLEVVGATKDLGGVIQLKIPSQILNKANIDPTSVDAEMVRGLMMDAANAHQGEQAYFILPSDTDAKGSSLFSMDLKGIDGAGKQYNTQDLVNSRKKAILDRFGAGFMNVGNDGTGSFSLSESKQTIHGHFVQRDIDLILEALNKNVIPQLLALNDIRLSDEEMPVIKSGLISKIDMEEFSKFIQRIGAVGYLPKTREVINKILEVGGIDYVIEDDMSQEEILELLGDSTSRSGDGMAQGSTGNGTAKISSTRDNSISNLEN